MSPLTRLRINSVSIHRVYQLDPPSHHPQKHPLQGLVSPALFCPEFLSAKIRDHFSAKCKIPQLYKKKNGSLNNIMSHPRILTFVLVSTVLASSIFYTYQFRRFHSIHFPHFCNPCFSLPWPPNWGWVGIVCQWLFPDWEKW